MLYRSSKQDDIDFLTHRESDAANVDNKKKVIANSEKDAILNQKAKKAKGTFDHTSKGGIQPSRYGNIHNDVTSSKHVGIEGKQKMFDTDDESNNDFGDNGEKIRYERERIESSRVNERQKRLDALAESIRDIDNRKDNTVSKMSSYETPDNYGYNRNPRNSFSIFDENLDMSEKVSDKTEGEKIADERGKMKKEYNWKKEGGKVVKASDMLKKEWLQ